MSDCGYCRVDTEARAGEVLGDGVGVRFPDISVSWDRHGSPAVVLASRFPKYVRLAVAKFELRKIPRPQVSGTVIYSWSIFHDPIHEPGDVNFVHCEIRTFKNAERVNEGEHVNKGIKKAFRQALGEALIVIVEAGTAEQTVRELHKHIAGRYPLAAEPLN